MSRNNNLAIREKPTLVEKLVKRDETFWALKDINLEIKKGERVEIKGPKESAALQA